MSVLDAVAGYPVHAVQVYSKHVTGHGIMLTDWTATCGATGQLVGAAARFGLAKSARKAELCRACWPAGHQTYHPEPIEVGP